MAYFGVRLNGDESVGLETKGGYFLGQKYPAKKIPSWSSGTDEEIVAALNAHYAGEIDLTQYWSVGDERVIHLSAMEATGVGESHIEQDVTMVIMNVDNGEDDVSNPNYNYQLVTPINGITRPAFIVQQKNLLANESTLEGGYMNNSFTNSGGWNGCGRRIWCNGIYKNALPEIFKTIFKQVKVKAMNGGNQSGVALITSEDFFFYPAEREVTDSRVQSAQEEWDSLYQWNYYTMLSNRIKYAGSVRHSWWLRSTYSSNNAYFTFVYVAGNIGTYYTEDALSFAPAGCI